MDDLVVADVAEVPASSATFDREDITDARQFAGLGGRIRKNAYGYAGRTRAAERLGVERRFQVFECQRVVEDVDVRDRVGVTRERRAGGAEQRAAAGQRRPAKARSAQKAG